MAAQVIVLNSGSSSGKSRIARCLRAVRPDPWLVFGVDTLIRPEVDTTHAGALDRARAIAARVR